MRLLRQNSARIVAGVAGPQQVHLLAGNYGMRCCTLKGKKKNAIWTLRQLSSTVNVYCLVSAYETRLLAVHGHPLGNNGIAHDLSAGQTTCDHWALIKVFS